jgi:mannose-6-phosphate isomerase-like protein (cupin superfamily)
VLIKGISLTESNGRKPYPVEGCGFPLIHFVVRTTSSNNPFKPHKHEKKEVWYVLEGRGLYIENGSETVVETGDMMIIGPWDEHGLRTDTQIKWMCLG